MSRFSDVREHPEFTHDKKKLAKRFRTIEEDLDKLIEYQLFLYHKLKRDNHGIFRIPGLGFEHPPVYKVKKFACRSIKGKGANTGLRLIYAYFDADDRVELIQLYFKERQGTDCDKDRIKRLYY